MKSNVYISYLTHVSNDLKQVYKDNGHPCEPIYTSIWYKDFEGEKRLIPVFIHEKDINRNTIKSLRYTFREI